MNAAAASPSANLRVGPANASPRVIALAVVAVSASAAVALLDDGDLEPIAVMVGAVIAALACFDRSLDRTMKVFWPWQILSVAVLAKAVPSVVFELAADGSLPYERYDQVGTTLAAACVALAMTLLAAPAGRRRTLLSLGTIGFCGLASGAGGATLAFVADPGYVTLREARGFETAGWVTVGLILSAAAIAVVVVDHVSHALLGLVALASAVAAVTALSSAGRDVDLGWWLLIWAGQTFAAGVLGTTKLGERHERSRPGRSVTGIALVGAASAAACLVWSGVGESTAEQGWLALALVATGLVILASLAAVAFTGPVPEARSPDAPSLEPPVAASSDLAMVAEAAIETAVPDPLSPDDRATDLDPSLSTAESGPTPPEMATTFTEPPTRPTDISGPALGPSEHAAPLAQTDPSAPDEFSDEVPVDPVDPVDPNSPSGDPGARAEMRRSEPILPATLVTVGLQPHHLDPPTGLLSGSGLQEVLSRAFSSAHRQPGEISLLMVALRNADEIEAAHGRIAGATVNQVLAERLVTGMPNAVCARYMRSGFAAVADHRSGPPGEIIELFTGVLLELLEDVDVGEAVAHIDVVGGMAQCYGDEHVTPFVARANAGLEQAVRSVDPTLVAMP